MKAYTKQLKKWERRRARIMRMADAGMDNQAIADKLGDITRQRVSQIVIAERKKVTP